MMLYVITDWLGLVPIFVCMFFGGIGLAQLIKRRSLWKVDRDIIVLGIYYVIVIACYLVFEMNLTSVMLVWQIWKLGLERHGRQSQGILIISLKRDL